MSNDPYLVVNPVVRIEESKLLSDDKIRAMVDGTWEDCVAILKASDYSKYLKNDDFDQNYASYILDYQLSILDKLYEIAPDKSVMALFMLRFTYHNTKMIMKALLAQEEYESYIIPDRLYSASEIEDAILHQKSDVLHPMLMKAILEADVQLQQQYKSIGIDIIMDRYYLKDMARLADEIGDEDILHYVKSLIDCYNLSTCFRAVKQKKELNFIGAILSYHGYFNTDELVAACTSSANLLEFVQKSAYAELMSEEDLDNLSLFDVNSDKYLHGLLGKSKLVAFGPLPLMALLETHEKQRKNMQLILSSKQSGIDIEQVRERLR